MTDSKAARLLDEFEALGRGPDSPQAQERACRIQCELAAFVSCSEADGLDPAEIRFGGVDVFYDEAAGLAVACAVALVPGSLLPAECSVVERPVAFPYVPGLFSLREAEIAADALRLLRDEPDVLVVDAQGLAHERRFGLACHLGLRLGVRSVGVAKNLRAGAVEGVLGEAAGSSAPILCDGATVGLALRTRAGVNPVYVSVGDGLSLEQARACALAACKGFRIPETTRFTDFLGRRLAPLSPEERAPWLGLRAFEAPALSKNGYGLKFGAKK